MINTEFLFNKETFSIGIRLGHLDCKIKGIVCENLEINIIAGLYQLRQIKSVIDWDSSVLTVSRNGVNYKIYLINLDYRMKDFIFVELLKLNPTLSNQL